jgi:hypothetical protein
MEPQDKKQKQINKEIVEILAAIVSNSNVYSEALAEQVQMLAQSVSHE